MVIVSGSENVTVAVGGVVSVVSVGLPPALGVGVMLSSATTSSPVPEFAVVTSAATDRSRCNFR